MNLTSAKPDYGSKATLIPLRAHAAPAGSSPTSVPRHSCTPCKTADYKAEIPKCLYLERSLSRRFQVNDNPLKRGNLVAEMIFQPLAEVVSFLNRKLWVE